MPELFSLEICAGGGGQALGLQTAGFRHAAVIEIEAIACETLTANRPDWNVINKDIRNFSGRGYAGVDLFAGGVPCPPFSTAGRQLGETDDRDLFPAALDLIEQIKPKAVLLENVPGFAKSKFAPYRDRLIARLRAAGYSFVDWQILNACNFGVPQLRPRFVLIALQGRAARRFTWPQISFAPLTVGETLQDLMGSRGWPGVSAWTARANGIAPTLVGGSKLHGGPDLGPTRAKSAWRELGVDGMGIADNPPDEDFAIDGSPKLTTRMTARLQGFPDEWVFAGRKTASYRQIGNAFPPPVAHAVGAALIRALAGPVRLARELEAELSVG